MPFITNNESKEKVDIFYQDHGSGKPVILIHGWPLSHKMWEHQVWKVVKSGFRCITYDRRGFGQSTATWDGYDYSTLASDLDCIIRSLELDNVTIVGFSMGGGEVVRYLTDFGRAKIAKAALISSIIPLVKQKPDNPQGVPEAILDDIQNALEKDRVGFLKEFHKGFYNYGENKGKLISKAQLDYDFNIASMASPRATIQAALSWMHTDFRTELKNVDVPTLIVHGDADNSVPMATSATLAAKGIANNDFHIIKGGPHGLNITHAKELNAILMSFLAQ